MDDQAQTLEMNMKLADIPGTSLKLSPVAIGTWAIGGWMWGGSDEAESIATIRAALEHGINIIDTAPVYGFGRSSKASCARTWLSLRRPGCNGRAAG
jgi:aryl-alcohol dehydrogenase-like predicted oxidoreductase